MGHQLIYSEIINEPQNNCGCNHSGPANKSVHLYTKESLFVRTGLEKKLNQYPSLAEKKYQIQRQELNKDLIKKERLPEVNFQAQQSYGSYQGFAGAFFPLAGMYNTSGIDKGLNGQTKSISNLYASALLQWNFLQFGRIKSKVNVADAAIKLSNT